MKKQKSAKKPEKVAISDLRCKHINKQICIEGKMFFASEVRPQCVVAKFECPKCETIISVLQIEKRFREPSRCSCGRKGQFRLISREMVDAQRIVLGEGEERYDELYEKKVPIRRISVYLSEELTDPKHKISEKVGKRARVIGILKEVPILNDFGEICTKFDIAIEANNLKFKK
jgi:DNA replicative helicase MCM subunit Mcm2 (Cdc46/Mcm family)